MRNATQYLIHQDLSISRLVSLGRADTCVRKRYSSGFPLASGATIIQACPKSAFSMIRWRRFSLHAQALPNGLQSSSKQQTSPRRDGTIKSSARKCRVGIANRSSPGRDGTEPPSSPSGSSSFDLGPQPDFLHQDRGRSSSYKINPTESSEISGQSENYWPDGITRLAHLRVRTER